MVNREQFLAKHAEFANDLRAYFADTDALDQLVRGISGLLAQDTDSTEGMDSRSGPTGMPEAEDTQGDSVRLQPGDQLGHTGVTRSAKEGLVGCTSAETMSSSAKWPGGESPTGEGVRRRTEPSEAAPTRLWAGFILSGPGN